MNGDWRNKEISPPVAVMLLVLPVVVLIALIVWQVDTTAPWQ